MAGRYVGKTTQEERLTFEVLPGGTSLKDFFINSINMSCQPPNIVSFYGTSDNYGVPKTASIAADGTFVIANRVDETDSDAVRWQWDTRVTGRFTGQTAAGALAVNARITVPGFPVDIVCNAPNVTWTAALSP